MITLSDMILTTIWGHPVDDNNTHIKIGNWIESSKSKSGPSSIGRTRDTRDVLTPQSAWSASFLSSFPFHFVIVDVFVDDIFIRNFEVDFEEQGIRLITWDSYNDNNDWWSDIDVSPFIFALFISWPRTVSIFVPDIGNFFASRKDLSSGDPHDICDLQKWCASDAWYWSARWGRRIMRSRSCRGTDKISWFYWQRKNMWRGNLIDVNWSSTNDWAINCKRRNIFIAWIIYERRKEICQSSKTMLKTKRQMKERKLTRRKFRWRPLRNVAVRSEYE